MPTLDARNLICPLPVIRTQQMIESMADGEQLLVVASDPGAMHDVPAWCRVHGHEITDSDETNGEFRIWIRVRKSPGATAAISARLVISCWGQRTAAHSSRLFLTPSASPFVQAFSTARSSGRSGTDGAGFAATVPERRVLNNRNAVVSQPVARARLIQGQ